MPEINFTEEDLKGPKVRAVPYDCQTNGATI